MSNDQSAPERALKFLNGAQEAEDLKRHYYNPEGKLVHYIIGEEMAKQIFALRQEHGGTFEHINALLPLGRFGEKKLDLLVASFEEDYLKMLEAPPTPDEREMQQKALDQEARDKVSMACAQLRGSGFSVGPVALFLEESPAGVSVPAGLFHPKEVDTLLLLHSELQPQQTVQLRLRCFDAQQRFQISTRIRLKV